jgi:hypothetical protein
MLNRSSLLAAVICSFVFAGAALAEPSNMPVKLSILSGEVTSINIPAKQIVIKNNIVFDVADKASIKKEGKEITLSNIKIGDPLIIAYKPLGDKKLATIIKVRAPKIGAN